MSPDDLEVIRDLIREADLEAIGADSKAAACWAMGEDDFAQNQTDLATLYQARSQALSAALARLEPTGQVDPVVRQAEPERRRPALTLHLNPEKTA